MGPTIWGIASIATGRRLIGAIFQRIEQIGQRKWWHATDSIRDRMDSESVNRRKMMSELGF